jgi:hypothetical protein
VIDVTRITESFKLKGVIFTRPAALSTANAPLAAGLDESARAINNRAIQAELARYDR